MLKIQRTNRLKKEFQKMIKRGHSVEKFTEVVKYLVNEKPLPPEYKDHKLQGNFDGYRECHIEPDWLLVYKIQNEILTLLLSRTGTHSNLFT